MIYITGNTHRDFSRFLNIDTTSDDMFIILGDAGINYYLDERDKELKRRLNEYYKFFIIQGNHEERPENIKTYHEKEMFGGTVFIEEEFPNLIFAKNGEVYTIDGKSVLVVGGAYSVDKDYRLSKGYQWFKDEQLSVKEQNDILDKYHGKHIDIILSHTTPLKYEPVEVFMSGISQSRVDKTMEKFLDALEETIDYDKWYCGHYHTEKQVDKIEFMFGRIKFFNKNEFFPKFMYNDYLIVRDYCSKEVINDKVICPKCQSDKIAILKGNGYDIIGSDEIAIICDDCHKVYGFNDVKYYPNCPRQL